MSDTRIELLLVIALAILALIPLIAHAMTVEAPTPAVMPHQAATTTVLIAAPRAVEPEKITPQPDHIPQVENMVHEEGSLEEYLAKRNPALVPYADEIAALPEPEKVLAIAVTETSLCTAGVGRSKNNCGALRGPSGFKTYGNAMEGLEALSTLLQAKYGGQSPAQMNGVYCVAHDVHGGDCPGWDAAIVNEMRTVQRHL